VADVGGDARVILDPLVPAALPLGARGSGPFAPCAVCVALDPARRGCEEVRLYAVPGEEPLVLRVARRRGTHLYYGATPICLPHARRIEGATWGPRTEERWADLAECVAFIRSVST